MVSEKVAAILRAEKYDSKLKSDDPRLNGAVLIQHQDGTILLYQSAFFTLYQSKWLMVFTKYHRSHVYPIDDLKSYRSFISNPVDIEELQ